MRNMLLKKVYVVIDVHVNWKMWKLIGKKRHDNEYDRRFSVVREGDESVAHVYHNRDNENGYRDPGS